MKIDNRVEQILWMTLAVLMVLAVVSSAQEPVFASAPSLFSDKRAYRVNDVLTILLMEYTQGTNQANTDSDVEHNLQLKGGSSGWLDFIPGLGLDAGVNSEQRSQGSTTRQGTLRGKMSARIIELLSNGDLKIEGRRMVEINGEEQITVLTGIVRPSDVLADNTVYSFLIADASISYRGRGLVDDAAKPGILSRFVNWLF